MSDQVWQPIETAPKDGTHVLVFILAKYPPEVTVAHWFNGGWWPSVCRNDYETALPVSHWMPLPNTMHLEGMTQEKKPKELI